MRPRSPSTRRRCGSQRPLSIARAFSSDVALVPRRPSGRQDKGETFRHGVTAFVRDFLGRCLPAVALTGR